jgi:hypothetical protein
MANIHISDITSTKLQKIEELDLLADSEDYLKELSNLEKDKIHGGRWVDDPCWRTVWVY